MFSFHISCHLQFVFLEACHKLFTQPLKLKMWGLDWLETGEGEYNFQLFMAAAGQDIRRRADIYLINAWPLKAHHEVLKVFYSHTI